MDPTEEMQKKIDDCIYETKIITSIVILNTLIGTLLLMGVYFIILKAL